VGRQDRHGFGYASASLPGGLIATSNYVCSVHHKGVKVIGGDKVATTEVSWGRVGGDGDTANCKNGHATASAGNFNENNEGEELDLVAEVLRHVADKEE
jgi:hypothetical protein